MAATFPTADSGDTTTLYSRINARLLPFLLLCYLFAYLDRVNVGFAKLQMQTDLGFSDAAYGVGAGIFFIGYVLFELPSNLLLPRIGARRTFGRILVLWGITSACMMFVKSVPAFYAMRFLLGVFEAGFAPGMIFYLSRWYGPSRMARAIAMVFLAGPIGGIIGGPLSAGVMTALAHTGGLAGWQWMFLVEGLPCIVLGIATFLFLPNGPADATWLSAAEKRTLEAEVGVAAAHATSFRDVLKDRRVYGLALAYFCIIASIYAISFWLPAILKAQGVASLTTLGWYTSIPYVAAAVGMVYMGRRSDRVGERRFHCALPAAAAALLFAACALTGVHLAVSLVLLTLVTAALWMAYTVFWAIPPEYIKGPAAAGGIALINTIGLSGGFWGPAAIGWIKTATGSLQPAYFALAGISLLATLIVLTIRLPGTKR
jgi:sugar phosphate permease